MLGLKGVEHVAVPHHLRRGEQRAAGYLALNPQGLVPALELDHDTVLTQSLAICEYLDEIHPHPPRLPTDPLWRARARAFAQVIACDTHPLQNLRVLDRLRSLGHDEATVTAWAAGVITEGLDACEALLGDRDTPFCFGEQPSLADICLVPQLGNARRFGVPPRHPRLLRIEKTCRQLAAFADAEPARQGDAD